jgi:hypothetical protein
MLRGQKGLGHILSGTDAGSGGASPKAVCRIINTINILLVKVDANESKSGRSQSADIGSNFVGNLINDIIIIFYCCINTVCMLES